jgi:hypothetical protein
MSPVNLRADYHSSACVVLVCWSDDGHSCGRACGSGGGIRAGVAAAAAAIVVVIVFGDAIAECRAPAREHHNDVDNHDQSKDAEQGELDPLPHHLVLDGLPARGIVGGSKTVNAVM